MAWVRVVAAQQKSKCKLSQSAVNREMEIYNHFEKLAMLWVYWFGFGWMSEASEVKTYDGWTRNTFFRFVSVEIMAITGYIFDIYYIHL